MLTAIDEITVMKEVDKVSSLHSMLSRRSEKGRESVRNEDTVIRVLWCSLNRFFTFIQIASNVSANCIINPSSHFLTLSE